MKRVALVFFLLAIFVVVKFSVEDLSVPSFFLKIGLNSESKEYSFFIEAGGKNEIAKQLAPINRGRLKNDAPSILQSRVVEQSTKAQVKTDSMSSNIKKRAKNNVGSSGDDADYENEFALALVDFSSTNPEVESVVRISSASYQKDVDSISVTRITDELNIFTEIVPSISEDEFVHVVGESVAEQPGLELAFINVEVEDLGRECDLEKFQHASAVEFAVDAFSDEVLSECEGIQLQSQEQSNGADVVIGSVDESLNVDELESFTLVFEDLLERSMLDEADVEFISIYQSGYNTKNKESFNASNDQGYIDDNNGLDQDNREAGFENGIDVDTLLSESDDKTSVTMKDSGSQENSRFQSVNSLLIKVYNLFISYLTNYVLEPNYSPFLEEVSTDNYELFSAPEKHETVQSDIE